MRAEITWRPAVREDLARIVELWDEQDRRFAGTGVKVDRPELFCGEDEAGKAFYPYKAPVIKVQVAEEAGVVTGFRYVELVPENSIVTGSQAVIESLGVELTREAHWAKQQGMRSGWGLVPTKFLGPLTRAFRKFPHIRPWKTLTPVGIDFSELGD